MNRLKIAAEEALSLCKDILDKYDAPSKIIRAHRGPSSPSGAVAPLRSNFAVLQNL
ncbi:MAG: hypothetical protein H0U71_07390 [Gammaproteobacteria bacterium]|nr:hypothetical protein [Gammaproteobacteria bacterium]